LEDAARAQKKHKPEEIVAMLRQVDVLLSQGRPVAEAIRTIGVTAFKHRFNLREACSAAKDPHSREHCADHIEKHVGASKQVRFSGKLFRVVAYAANAWNEDHS